MSKSPFDVLILGAGAAGLAAAAQLSKAGRSALVVEARDRIGGRIWTLDEPGLPLPIELGAEFIHGQPPVTFELLRQHSIAAVDAPADHWLLRQGRLQPMEDYFKQIQLALRSVRLKGEDLSFATLLDRIGSKNMSRAARNFARTLVEGFDAADPARVSARSIIDEWSGDSAASAPTFRPLGGYRALLAAMARTLEQGNVRIQLQAEIHAVRWEQGAVEVEGLHAGQSFRANAARAIVTLPLGVLQLSPGMRGAVDFIQPLEEKQKAIHLLAAGPVVKVALQFSEAFWEKMEKGRYRDVAFFHEPAAAFPTFWTTLPLHTPILIAWAGGPKAEQLTRSDRDRIVGEAIESLKMIFGKRVNIGKEFKAAYLHDWQRDSCARGAYSYVTVGGGRARSTLAKPVQQTLYFAGEAADIGNEAGTVAGALASGRRAARLALRDFPTR